MSTLASEIPYGHAQRTLALALRRPPKAFKEWGPGEITERIQAGLPGKALLRVKRLYGLDNARLGQFLGIRGDKTIAKRLNAPRLSPVDSDRVWRLLRLWEEAALTLEAEEAAIRQWFHTPAVRLGGRTPLTLAGTEEGARLVSNTLGAIEHALPV